jgi:hypothetical protein
MAYRRTRWWPELKHQFIECCTDRRPQDKPNRRCDYQCPYRIGRRIILGFREHPQWINRFDIHNRTPSVIRAPRLAPLCDTFVGLPLFSRSCAAIATRLSCPFSLRVNYSGPEDRCLLRLPPPPENPVERPGDAFRWLAGKEVNQPLELRRVAG